MPGLCIREEEREEERARDRSRRERAATILDRSYPKVAAKIRAGMRSSTWPEDLIDPGLLLDLLETEPVVSKP